MALGTLAELRDAVLLTRSDLVSRFGDVLALAEQRIYYGGDGVPPLRTRGMEATGDITLTAGVGTLPALFLDKRAVYWQGAQTVALSYEPPNLFYGQEYSRRGGAYPEAYTIEGGSLKISPDLTGTAKLLYYGKAAPLSADTDTNVILASFPGVYIYGCLTELHRITRDATQEALNMRRYADAVQAANTYTIMSRTFGGAVKRRTISMGA